MVVLEPSNTTTGNNNNYTVIAFTPEALLYLSVRLDVFVDSLIDQEE